MSSSLFDRIDDEDLTHIQNRGMLAAGFVGFHLAKMDSTVRYLGVDLEDALSISESLEI